MSQPAGVIRVKMGDKSVDALLVEQGKAITAFELPIEASGLFRSIKTTIRIEFDPPFMPVENPENYAPSPGSSS